LEDIVKIDYAPCGRLRLAPPRHRTGMFDATVKRVSLVTAYPMAVNACSIAAPTR